MKKRLIAGLALAAICATGVNDSVLAATHGKNASKIAKIVKVDPPRTPMLTPPELSAAPNAEQREEIYELAIKKSHRGPAARATYSRDYEKLRDRFTLANKSLQETTTQESPDPQAPLRDRFAVSRMLIEIESLYEPLKSRLPNGNQRPEAEYKANHAKFNSLPADYRYMTSQLRLLKPFEGIVWRIKPMIDGKDPTRYYNSAKRDRFLNTKVGKTAIARTADRLIKDAKEFKESLMSNQKAASMLATMFMQRIASMLHIYMPFDTSTKHAQAWHAIYDYLVLPPINVTHFPQFTTMEEFQDFIADEVFPAVDLSKEVTYNILSGIRQPFYADMRVLYPAASFQEGEDKDGIRFQNREIGWIELNATLAGYEIGLHSLFGFLAYDWNDLFLVSDQFGRARGMGTTVPTGFSGPTSAIRARIINNLVSVDGRGLINQSIEGLGERYNIKDAKKLLLPQQKTYAKFMTLRVDDPAAPKKEGDYGARMMKEAFKHLKTGIERVRESWRLVQRNSQENEDQVIRASRVMPWSKEVELMVSNWEGLVNTDAFPMRSYVTGETVVVKLRSFYEPKPPEDLKVFLPTTFNDGLLEARTKVKVDNREVETLYWDLKKGQPEGWDTAQFAPYLETPANDDPKYIKKVIRVLRQSWGGEFIAWPLWVAAM